VPLLSFCDGYKDCFNGYDESKYACSREYSIVLTFEEYFLKFENVRKSSRNNKVREKFEKFEIYINYKLSPEHISTMFISITFTINQNAAIAMQYAQKVHRN